MITTRITVSRNSSGGIRPIIKRYTRSGAASMTGVVTKTPSRRDVISRKLQRCAAAGHHPIRMRRARPRAGMLRCMQLGSSLFLITVGAILYFAVTATLAGISIQTVGLIFMIIGVIGFVLALIFMRRAANAPTTREYR
jgi:hypothetical protein